MNNITDITILIAVIALAMWPVVLLVLKTMNIRKKRLEHLERMTKTELYNPQIEMFAHFKTKSSFHKTKGII